MKHGQINVKRSNTMITETPPPPSLLSYFALAPIRNTSGAAIVNNCDPPHPKKQQQKPENQHPAQNAHFFCKETNQQKSFV